MYIILSNLFGDCLDGGDTVCHKLCVHVSEPRCTTLALHIPGNGDCARIMLPQLSTLHFGCLLLGADVLLSSAAIEIEVTNNRLIFVKRVQASQLCRSGSLDSMPEPLPDIGACLVLQPSDTSAGL